MSLEGRFWPKVMVAGDCWLWTGARTAEGYGSVWTKGRMEYAHRVAYELEVGPIPDGMVIDHLCRTRSCVNPAHLEPVTVGENIRRGETGAHHAAKTQCPNGHAYDDSNTGRGRSGRYCKTCKRERTRAARQR